MSTISAQVVTKHHGRPRAFSPAQETQIRKLHALGYSPVMIADRFGTALSTVRRFLGLEAQSCGAGVPYVRSVPVRMVVSPWFVDPADGLQTRTARGE